MPTRKEPFESAVCQFEKNEISCEFIYKDKTKDPKIQKGFDNIRISGCEVFLDKDKKLITLKTHFDEDEVQERIEGKRMSIRCRHWGKMTSY